MTPSTAYVLFISVSECTVVTLGKWFQIFKPSIGMRCSLNATISAAPTALCPRTMSAPCGVKIQEIGEGSRRYRIFRFGIEAATKGIRRRNITRKGVRLLLKEALESWFDFT